MRKEMNLKVSEFGGWIFANLPDGRISVPLRPVLPEVIFEKLHEDAVIPVYASEGDSGMDVYATEDIIIEPDETKLLKLGFRMEIPAHPLHDFGYRWEAQARPRSGLSLKTMLRVGNSTGTIDNFYRGEVGIILTNSRTLHDSATTCMTQTVGNENYLIDGEVPVGSYIIQKGDRIAQLVFAEIVRPMKMTEGTVSTDTDRGASGFGSTGVK